MHTETLINSKQVFVADDPILDQVEQTYNEAFPEAERRDFALVRQLIAEEPAFQLRVFYRDDVYVGFLSNWQFDGFRYVEHFAIDPAARNGGIGGLVLRLFLALQEDAVVLEVELPEDSLKKRRIGFYERHGFTFNEYPYIQPPMGEDRHEIPLRIMSAPEPLSEDEFQSVRTELYESVYHYVCEE